MRAYRALERLPLDEGSDCTGFLMFRKMRSDKFLPHHVNGNYTTPRELAYPGFSRNFLRNLGYRAKCEIWAAIWVATRDLGGAYACLCMGLDGLSSNVRACAALCFVGQ